MGRKPRSAAQVRAPGHPPRAPYWKFL
jgi:hypothetical protein